jgi:hypothetical protein
MLDLKQSKNEEIFFAFFLDIILKIFSTRRDFFTAQEENLLTYHFNNIL